MASSQNFSFLKYHNKLLVRLAQTAEECFVHDPNTTLMKMRQLGEELAKAVASRVGVQSGANVTQSDLIIALDYAIKLNRDVKSAFNTLRKLGNSAIHDVTSKSHKDALNALQVGYAVSVWFHKTFADHAFQQINIPCFEKPIDPSIKVRALEEQIIELKNKHTHAQDRVAHVQKLQDLQQQKLEAEKLRADEIEKQRQSWENLAIETDEQFAQYKIKAQEENDKYRKAFEALTSDQQAKTKQKIESATIELSESDTRILIDQQLMDSDWEADTVNLRYAKGARPIKGKNRAIAEWPTASGHADYVLFIGLTPIATIEAKRRNRNVYDCIDQAKRYARDFKELYF